MKGIEKMVLSVYYGIGKSQVIVLAGMYDVKIHLDLIRFCEIRSDRRF